MTENKRIDSHHVNRVTVYASSSTALNPVFYDDAYRLGELLAGASKTIVYGASGHGLMGAVADGALVILEAPASWNGATFTGWSGSVTSSSTTIWIGKSRSCKR